VESVRICFPPSRAGLGEHIALDTSGLMLDPANLKPRTVFLAGSLFKDGKKLEEREIDESTGYLQIELEEYGTGNPTSAVARVALRKEEIVGWIQHKLPLSPVYDIPVLAFQDIYHTFTAQQAAWRAVSAALKRYQQPNLQSSLLMAKEKIDSIYSMHADAYTQQINAYLATLSLPMLEHPSLAKLLDAYLQC
jgi:hypothetical protein